MAKTAKDITSDYRAGNITRQQAVQQRRSLANQRSTASSTTSSSPSTKTMIGEGFSASSSYSPSTETPGAYTFQRSVSRGGDTESLTREVAAPLTGQAARTVNSTTGRELDRRIRQRQQDRINAETPPTQISPPTVLGSGGFEREAAKAQRELLMQQQRTPVEPAPSIEMPDYSAFQDDIKFQLTELNTQVDNELIQANNIFDTIQQGIDDDLQGILGDIRSTYDIRRREQQRINQAEMAIQTQAGIRSGRQRYAPEVQAGILSATESAGLQRLMDLDAEEQTAIGEAKRAARDKDLSVMLQKMNVARQARQDKSTALKDLLNISRQQESDMMARQEFRQRQQQFEIALQDRERETMIENAGIYTTANLTTSPDGTVKIPNDLQLKRIAESMGIDPTVLKATMIERKEELEEIARTTSYENMLNEIEIDRKRAELQQTQLENDAIQYENYLASGGTLDYGTFEGYNQQILGGAGVDTSTLTLEQKWAAKTIVRDTLGANAANDASTVQMVEQMLAQGKSREDIEDLVRFSNSASLYDKEIKDATKNIAGFLTEEKSKNFIDRINSVMGNDDMYQIREQLTRGVEETLDVETARSFRGDARAVDLINEIEDDLARYEANGGDTGVFAGTEEAVQNKIGRTSDPELKAIANKIQVAIQKYRKAVSGAAFTESESKEYKSIFPSTSNTSELNSAVIDSLKSVLQGNVDFTMERALGRDQYNKIFGRDIERGISAIDNAFNNLITTIDDDQIDLVQKRIKQANERGEDIYNVKVEMLEMMGGNSPSFSVQSMTTGQKEALNFFVNKVKGFLGGTSKYLDLFGPITGYGSPYWKPGLDVDVAKGDPVPSPQDAEVVAVRPESETGGFGNQIKLKFADNMELWVSHLDNMLVKPGMKIKKGQLIGLGGNTGNVIPMGSGDGSHLDLTLKKPDGSLATAQEVQKYLLNIV